MQVLKKVLFLQSGEDKAADISKMDNSEEVSSEIELQVDRKSGHLGPPKEITSTSSNATHRGLSIVRCGARSKVTHLQHGICGGKPASLICFRLFFRFDSSSSRFTKTEVKVSFERQESQEPASGPSELPLVAKFAPVHVRGRVTEAAISQKMSTSLDASIAPTAASIFGIGPSIGYERVRDFKKEYSMEIKGIPWPSGDEDVENMVIWKVAENARQADGIPNELNVAVVVQHDGKPFHGVVEILTWTKSGVKLFGWPWPKPNPLVFRPTVSIGPPIDVATFDDLTDEQLYGLVPLPVGAVC